LYRNQERVGFPTSLGKKVEQLVIFATILWSDNYRKGNSERWGGVLVGANKPGCAAKEEILPPWLGARLKERD